MSQIQSTFPSRTEDSRTEAFELQVARGHVLGHSLINLFGSQTAVGTTFVPIWEFVAQYVYPSAATTMSIVSTSASDTAVTVRIFGLDSSYNPITEAITLTGTTPKTTAGTYLRINSMLTVGGNAVGDITLTQGGNTYAKILAGIGRTQMSMYTVPAGYTFYLTRVDVYSNLNGGSNNHCNYRVKSISPSGVSLIVLQAPFIDRYEARRIVPFPYTEKTDIQWQASTAANTAHVGAVIEGILIKNDL
jgi:hypothetical protein